jgi:SHS2 domain-containing protein
MASPYEFFDHTADIGVHISGGSLQELFTNAAAALYAALGQLQRSDVGDQKLLEIQAATAEDLLHDWLAELLYEVETNHLVYNEVEITDLTPQHIAATLYGGEIDFDRSQVNNEIKGVTYHKLRVEQLPDTTWRATVILDV